MELEDLNGKEKCLESEVADGLHVESAEELKPEEREGKWTVREIHTTNITMNNVAV